MTSGAAESERFPDWCAERTPDEWQWMWGELDNGQRVDRYHEYWIVYRAWGQEGIDAGYSGRVIDVVFEARRDWKVVMALYELACTPQERLAALREAGYGWELVTSPETTAEQAKEYRRWLSMVDLGDPACQAEYVWNLVLLEAVDIDEIEVTDADIEEFKREFESIDHWRRARNPLMLADFEDYPPVFKRRGIVLVGLALDYGQTDIERRIRRHPERWVRITQ